MVSVLLNMFLMYSVFVNCKLVSKSRDRNKVNRRGLERHFAETGTRRL